MLGWRRQRESRQDEEEGSKGRVDNQRGKSVTDLLRVKPFYAGFRGGITCGNKEGRAGDWRHSHIQTTERRTM